MAKQYHILILALLLTSCASPPSPIALSDTKALHQGEVLVFGRVRVIQYGESIDWDSFIHLDAGCARARASLAACRRLHAPVRIEMWGNQLIW